MFILKPRPRDAYNMIVERYKDQIEDQNYSQDGNPTEIFNESINRHNGKTAHGPHTYANLQKFPTARTEAKKTSIAEGLSILLSDTYLLKLKTHNYHWNVTGPQFVTLHRLFKDQYEELGSAIEVIAERIRSLGSPVPATFLEFNQVASIKEELGVFSSSEMIASLYIGQEILIQVIRQVQMQTDVRDDMRSAGLLNQRIQAHENNAWVLRRILSH